LKGHVDLLILATLRSGPLHGYGIVEKLRDESEGAFELAEGTVYPALYRLERAGLLASRWTQAEGRRRRVYRLTRRGRAELERERKEWKSFANAVESVLT
jgi:PadR family transcriptional regulator